MILSKRKMTAENWDLILSELQQVRARGDWRGSFVQLRKKGELRIPFEPFAGTPTQAYASIYLSPDLTEVYASFSNGKDQLHLRDFDMKVDNFLEKVLKEVRQWAYIRTQKDKANYRG